MTFWCERAWVAGAVVESVRLVVDGDVLTTVAVAPPGPEDVRLPGLVLPGFANAHSHAFHRGLRGRTHVAGDFWSWRTLMYDLAGRLTPDTYLGLARAAYAEMVLAGWTVVGEFHYLHHGPGGVAYEDANAMGWALEQAAHEAGIRLTLLDACYLQGGLDGRPLEGPQLRFGDRDVEGWATRIAGLRDTATVRHGIAAHSVRAVPREALPVLARHPVRHVHLSEQPAENADCLAATGLTPTGLLAEEGFLGEGATTVHATHLTDDDVALLAGTHACLCPTTERDLADGIGPFRALAARSPLCVGSDQHAVVDPFEELRGVEAGERLASLQRGRFTPAELVTAGTSGGYASLGWDGGVLRAGALADLTVVRLDSPRTAGCDPSQVVMAATAADVSDVVVGGRHVVRDGQHALGDVGGLLAEAVAAAWDR